MVANPIMPGLKEVDPLDSFCRFVDNTDDLAEFIEAVRDLPTATPSLYVDLEGVNLSRHGTVSVIQIYVLPLDCTYVIDVQELKEKAFSHPSPTGYTLKDILESPSIPKVFFDVRSDSDALYSHFGIKLSCVHDVQLMELATRNFSRTLVHGLAKCIESDCSMPPSEKVAWKVRKEKGRKLFAPDQGGSYEIWNIRPLPAEIMQYCVQDVKVLARLWQKYIRGFNDDLHRLVEKEVNQRVTDSQSPDFIENGRPRTLAPHGWAQLPPPPPWLHCD